MLVFQSCSCGEDERPLNELLILQLGAEHPNGRYNISLCKIFGNHWNQGKRKYVRETGNMVTSWSKYVCLCMWHATFTTCRLNKLLVCPHAISKAEVLQVSISSLPLNIALDTDLSKTLKTFWQEASTWFYHQRNMVFSYGESNCSNCEKDAEHKHPILCSSGWF